MGFLGTVPLAAHVAANQFIGLSFMTLAQDLVACCRDLPRPAMGISSAAAALIGKMLGANRRDDIRS